MNFGELKATVRLNVDDEKGDLLTEPIAKNILSRAFSHIYRKLINARILTDLNTLTATFIANTREIIIGDTPRRPAEGHTTPATQLPSIQKVVAVQNNSGEEIPVLTRENALRSSVPAVYVRRVLEQADLQDSVYLGYHIVPTAGFDLIVEYIKRPLEIGRLEFINDDFESFILTSEYHDVVVLYATILFLAKDENKITFLNYWTSLYQEALADILEFNEGSEEVVDVYEGGWQ